MIALSEEDLLKSKTGWKSELLPQTARLWIERTSSWRKLKVLLPWTHEQTALSRIWRKPNRLIPDLEKVWIIWIEDHTNYSIPLNKAETQSKVLCCAKQLSHVRLFAVPGSSVHEDSPGKNTKVDCYALLQGIFPTQGSNPGLPHCRWIILPSEPPGEPKASANSPRFYEGWEVRKLQKKSLKLAETGLWGLRKEAVSIASLRKVTKQEPMH